MTLNKTSEHLFHRIILSLAVIIYGITAWNSHGFFYPDEHYQVLEFAGLKLGINEPWNLSWEYHEQIRSSVQPALAYVIIQLCNCLGLNDIYDQVVVLRLLTAVLALLSVSFFVKTVLTNNYIKQSRLYIFFSYFLLFIPFLSVRFAAETWGGLLLLIPTALLLQKNKPKPFIIGLLFGLSFVFRFQMAISIVGILLWIYMIRKENLNYLFKICISGLLVVSLATCIDAWFYGEFVFTPWQYFSATLFDNDLPRFHETPFYRYPIDIIIAFTPLLGSFVLEATGSDEAITIKHLAIMPGHALKLGLTTVSDNGDVEVFILSLGGRRVMSQTTSGMHTGGEILLNVSSLPHGLYMVVVRNNQGVAVRKFII